MAPRRYCFVFVCQAGELEIKALLLAASLRRFLRCDYELVAALPGPSAIWGDICASTSEILHALGVRIEPIVNPIDADYKIGNKIACLSVPTMAQRVVFLDSDILCLREFRDQALFDVAFAAKPADLRTFSASAKDWAPFYAAARVSPPRLRLPTTVSGEFGPPYFNSGVIFADAKADFGTAWMQCARSIDAEPAMRPHRHWLDQVALAIAVQQRDLPYASLDERYNFPAHLKPLPVQLPFFCHYHWTRVLRSEPVLLALIHDLVNETPAIGQRLAVDADWASLLHVRSAPRMPLRHRVFARRRPLCQELVLTGMPHGGMDDLCGLLRQFDNTVVVDDPDPIVTSSTHQQVPWEAATFLRNLRCDVREGRAVQNAHRHASTNVDTATVSGDAAAQASRPRPDNFVLAVSNSISFLCRLDALKRVFAQARFVACIADPFETIAAWKSGDAALREGDVASLALGYPDADWLPPAQSRVLHDIAAMTDAAERRATLWWWLAQRLLNQAQGVIVLRRDEIVADHAGSVRRILRGMHPGRRRVAAVQPARPQTHLLDDRDRQAIRAICSQAALELGLRCED